MTARLSGFFPSLSPSRHGHRTTIATYATARIRDDATTTLFFRAGREPYAGPYRLPAGTGQHQKRARSHLAAAPGRRDHTAAPYRLWRRHLAGAALEPGRRRAFLRAAGGGPRRTHAPAVRALARVEHSIRRARIA